METRVSLKYFVSYCSVTGLATNSVLTTVENKIPNASNLVKTNRL